MLSIKTLLYQTDTNQSQCNCIFWAHCRQTNKWRLEIRGLLKRGETLCCFVLCCSSCRQDPTSTCCARTDLFLPVKAQFTSYSAWEHPGYTFVSNQNEIPRPQRQKHVWINFEHWKCDNALIQRLGSLRSLQNGPLREKKKKMGAL